MCREQRLHDRNVTSVGRDHQRREASASVRIHIPASGNRLHRLQIAPCCRIKERRLL